MARADDDSWDIATSVGATAVMVAMARAAETGSEHPLIRDEYAEPLVSTPALAEVRERIASLWRTPDEAEDPAAGLAMHFQQMVNYQAVRTHFFDEYFAAAAAAGIRQHVILAAGLDSRAYRLDWPAGTVVYEIDLPAGARVQVHDVGRAGRRRPRRRGARWPSTCAETGPLRCAPPVSIPRVPTAWLAEGLLPFLPGQAQEAMFTAIDGLSAAGSRIAVEVFGVDEASRQEVEEQWRQTAGRARSSVVRPSCSTHSSSGTTTRTGPNVRNGSPPTAGPRGAVDSRDEFERLGRLGRRFRSTTRSTSSILRHRRTAALTGWLGSRHRRSRLGCPPVRKDAS